MNPEFKQWLQEQKYRYHYVMKNWMVSSIERDVEYYWLLWEWDEIMTSSK